jgi:hypothetical protein
VRGTPWHAYRVELLSTERGPEAHLDSTSATELRLARTAEQPQRAALAARLGLTLEATRPDALDRITFVTGTITDEQLAQIFGYRPTVAAPLDAPPPSAARLLLDKQAAARQRWRDLDALDRDDPAAPQPISLPGLLTDADFVDPSPAAPAHQQFIERTDFRAARRKLISDAVEGANRTPAGFDAAVNTFIGTLDITALAARDQNGEDIGGDPFPPSRLNGRYPLSLPTSAGASGNGRTRPSQRGRFGPAGYVAGGSPYLAKERGCTITMRRTAQPITPT